MISWPIFICCFDVSLWDFCIWVRIFLILRFIIKFFLTKEKKLSLSIQYRVTISFHFLKFKFENKNYLDKKIIKMVFFIHFKSIIVHSWNRKNIRIVLSLWFKFRSLSPSIDFNSMVNPSSYFCYHDLFHVHNYLFWPNSQLPTYFFSITFLLKLAYHFIIIATIIVTPYFKKFDVSITVNDFFFFFCITTFQWKCK